MAFSGTTFVYTLHRFENIDCHFLKQLPLHISSRYSYAILTIFIFTLPEGLMIIRNFPRDLNLNLAFEVYFFGLSLLMLLYSFLYTKDRTLENTMPFVYFLYMFFFILILFNVPIWLISLGSISGSFFLFNRHYYKMEFQRNIKREGPPVR